MSTPFSTRNRIWAVGLVLSLTILILPLSISEGGGGRLRFTVPFSASASASKYSLDAPLTANIPVLTTVIVRQGQFPANTNLFIYYVWCTDTALGGNIIIRQTGGAGWSFTFACIAGAPGGVYQNSNGNPGASTPLFTQSLGTSNNYDILEQSSDPINLQNMQGGFVLSTTNSPGQSQIPSAAFFVQNLFVINQGQKVYVWYESGSAASCASGTFICYIGLNPVSGSSCRLDLSGGSFVSSGSPEQSTALCTITGGVSLLTRTIQISMFNGDTVPRAISGLFVVSVF